MNNQNIRRSECFQNFNTQQYLVLFSGLHVKMPMMGRESIKIQVALGNVEHTHLNVVAVKLPNKQWPNVYSSFPLTMYSVDC